MKLKKIISILLLLNFSIFAFSEISITRNSQNEVEINITIKVESKIENKEKDIEEESELTPLIPLANFNPEKRKIIVKDSDSGEPIFEADASIDENWNLKTKNDGSLIIPNDVEDGEHSMVVSKNGIYVPTEVKFNLQNGELTTIPQISVPSIANYERIKIILDWGEKPSDLDTHIFCGGKHLHYNKMTEENMNLDRDDISSYGPETATIIDTKSDEKYEYYVFNYTNKDKPESEFLSNSGAQVRVFINNDLVKTFKIEQNQKGITWHVFDIINGTEIVEQNTISTERL